MSKGLEYGRGFLQDPAAQNYSLDERRRAKAVQNKWVFQPETRTAAYSASTGEVVKADPSTAGFTITLPSAQTHGAGAHLEIANVTSSVNTITVATVRSETILGASTYSMVLPYQAIHLVSDGSNWVVT